jgi:hypothetical protein
MDFPLPFRFNAREDRARSDEEDRVGNPPDVGAGLGATEAVTQERDRARR